VGLNNLDQEFAVNLKQLAVQSCSSSHVIISSRDPGQTRHILLVLNSSPTAYQLASLQAPSFIMIMTWFDMVREFVTIIPDCT
jgi:hypothetical protein